MKKFTCHYLDEDGQWDDEFPHTKIEAASVEEAARIFAEQHPRNHPSIAVSSSWGAPRLVDNPVREEREREQQRRERKQQRRAKEAEERQCLETLQKLHSSVESADGNLAGLPYLELSALVENLKDFPSMRDKISTEECAVREELYKVAFFDRNLQAALQTEQAGLQTEQAELQVGLLRDLKSAFTDLQSGKSGSGAGKSNLARNAAMLGGIAALQKLNQIEENTGDVSEGLGFD